MLKNRVVEPGVPWLVEETEELYSLFINEGAEIVAPEGKFLTLTVNGVGKPIQPGRYFGEVVMSVVTPYEMQAHGLKLNFAEMTGKDISGLDTPMKQALVISNGEIVEDQTNKAILQGGEITGSETDGVYITSTEEDYCGIIVDGEKAYTIKNSRFDLEGNGHDDWLGNGTAVSALDEVELEIDNCQFYYSGVTRCTLQASCKSNVVIKNSDFINIAPDGSDWVGDFSWQVGFHGHNRLTQLSDNASVRYENCRLHSNGWGICSIDGTGDPMVREDDNREWPADCKEPGYGVTMYMKDCDMRLTGPNSHGYGAFCIGDNKITYDHTNCDVYGYPILLMGMFGKGHFDVINGSKISGRRFGAFIIDDDNSVLNIADSSFDTKEANIVLKGAATTINITNSDMKAANGTIVQVMDCDEAGMNQADYTIPVGRKDTKDDSLDLTSAGAEDVVLNIKDCDLKGNFYNSTTQLRAYKDRMIGGMGKLHDTVLGKVPMPPADAPSPAQMRHNGNDLKGAKNLGLNLTATKITGVISSASQAYREGLGRISSENWFELSNITQEAAETINNGVVVNLDAASSWTVTGTSYISALTLAEGAKLEAADGKKLTMTVDGVETPVAAGTYTGSIVLTVA